MLRLSRPGAKALRRELDLVERVSAFIPTTKTQAIVQETLLRSPLGQAPADAGLSNPRQIATITGDSLKTVTVILDHYTVPSQLMTRWPLV